MLLVGCGDNVTTDITPIKPGDTELKCPDVVCPECQVCEECEKCPECNDKKCPECEKCRDCPDCPKQNCPTCAVCETCKDFSQNPVEVELNAIRLYSQEKPDDFEYMIQFTYTNASRTMLDTSELSFKALCDAAPKKLQISLNKHQFYDQVPPCDQTIQLFLDKNFVFIGVNNITFKSDVSESYRIDNIEIESKFNDSTYNIDQFDYIRLEERFLETTKFSDLSDVNMTNYLIYSVNLTENETREDMLIKFDSDTRNGYLYVHINNYLVFNGSVKTTNNEVFLPKNQLRVGPNEIRFLTISN